MKVLKNSNFTISRQKNIIKARNVRAVDTGGNRNETPLTARQIQEVKDFAIQLGMPADRIAYSDSYNTSYGSEFDLLMIGTDVYPSKNAKTANQRLSYRASIAHEIIGHRRAKFNGTQFDNSTLFGELCDEVQASINAARYAPGLSKADRICLMRDALERIKNKGYVPRDVLSLIQIDGGE